MQTQQTSDESPDSRHLAYGREVAALLSQSSPAAWVDDLWDIYSGYVLAQEQLGHNPRGSQVFTSFKELVFFFQRMQGLKS